MGGLGVRDLVIKNIALLFKLWWKFSYYSTPLWKRVVCSDCSLDESIS